MEEPGERSYCARAASWKIKAASNRDIFGNSETIKDSKKSIQIICYFRHKNKLMGRRRKKEKNEEEKINGRGRPLKRKSLSSDTKRSIVAVFLIALAILAVFSLFGGAGTFGTYLNKILSLAFGVRTISAAGSHDHCRVSCISGGIRNPIMFLWRPDSFFFSRAFSESFIFSIRFPK